MVIEITGVVYSGRLGGGGGGGHSGIEGAHTLVIKI